MANIPDIVSTMFRVEFPTPVQLEVAVPPSILSNMRVEAGFSEAHRRRTAPVAKATTLVTEATSSWDSDSVAEIVATIHNNEAPWFDVVDRSVFARDCNGRGSRRF